MERLPLDPYIAALADRDAEWLHAVISRGRALGMAAPVAVKCWHLTEDALHRSFRAAAIAAGVRRPSPRETAADRRAKTVAAFFGPRRPLGGEARS